MNFSNIRLLRTVKRDTLRLVRSFLDAATPQGAAEVRLTPEQIAQRFVPPLLEPWGGLRLRIGDGNYRNLALFGQSGPPK